MRRTKKLLNMISHHNPLPEGKLPWYNQLSGETFFFKFYYLPFNFVPREKISNTAQSWSNILLFMSISWSITLLFILDFLYFKYEVNNKQERKRAIREIYEKELKELREEEELLKWAFDDENLKKNKKR